VRLIKLALLSFIFLFLLLTGISLFIPSHIRISRAIQIERSKGLVSSPINDPAQWSNWYPGADSAEVIYRNGLAVGIDLKKKGSKILLSGTKKNNEITASVVGSGTKTVNMGWTFISPADNSVTLQWYMDFHLKWYPWEKFSSLLYEKTYGVKMEEGLKNLKTLVEKQAIGQ
jgi:hypothetical protein